MKNHVRWIYLTTVLYMGESMRDWREIEFPHCQATLSRMYLRKVNDIIAAPLEFINELFMMKLL